MEENRYSLGYTHGIEQARPIVDLEHRVKGLEHQVSLLGWVGTFVGGYLAAKVLYGITHSIKGLMMGSGPIDNGKAKTEGNVIEEPNEDGNTRRTNQKSVRQHTRDFNIRN